MQKKYIKVIEIDQVPDQLKKGESLSNLAVAKNHYKFKNLGSKSWFLTFVPMLI